MSKKILKNIVGVVLIIFALVWLIIIIYPVKKNSTLGATTTTNATAKPSQIKTITHAELVKHSTASDCWLAIDQKVYAISSFLTQHPGGASVIINVCGTDATNIFTQIHSQRAFSILPDYFIGDYRG